MHAGGLRPDPWQADLVNDPHDRTLLLCSRSAGKSAAAAALAVAEVLLVPGSLVLMVSPTERQSGELARKAFAYLDGLGAPVPALKRTELQLDLANGSRLIALPGNERNIRTYNGVSLLVIDEAARVEDALYKTVRPMLAVSAGRLLALSTPFGKRGWFYEAWEGDERWRRVRVPARDCPRIPAAFLAEERKALGERWFAQEYDCEFRDVVDAVFSAESIAAAFAPEVKPLF